MDFAYEHGIDTGRRGDMKRSQSFIADNGQRLPFFDNISDAIDRVNKRIEDAEYRPAEWRRMDKARTILLRLWREVNDNAHIP